MDTFFISHGSPTLSIDDSMPARHFLKSWVPTGLAGPHPPRAHPRRATHNLSRITRHGQPPPPPRWAVEFDAWLRETLVGGRHGDVKRYREAAAPHAEHLYPLHVALGAAGDGCEAELIHHSWSNASLSYASYRFTSSRN
nr:unnamed protein product [Digitaria exilis]